MKVSNYIGIVGVLLFVFSVSSFSQERVRRQRASDIQTDNTPTLTERAQIKSEINSKTPAHVAWLRELYRDINLEKEANAPLLYPDEPIGDRVNLFTHIFRLVLSGKVPAYNYLAGKEIFKESEKVDLKKILEKLRIAYTTEGPENNPRYIVEDIDIPGSEVTRYFIKESWFFNESTGTFDSKVTALCPMLVRMDYETGIVDNEAFFWVEYEDIRPYISREMIVTSNYNNVLTYSIDDFFSKRMYDGDIFKTLNLKNQGLAQQIGSTDPKDLKAAQDSIEAQIKGFEHQLWIHPDTTTVVAKNEKTKTSSSRRKEPKVKEAKADKSSSAPTRSVRGRRGNNR